MQTQSFDEAFDYFEEFKTFVEKQRGHSMKCFCSNEFFQFYKENDIKRHISSLYTPHQNDLAKRKNQTLVEMARSMIQS